ncbi:MULTISPECIES: NAD(P)-dependent oxidoreductase [Rhodococcus]|uniref:3-hydroxyisobutyrate dehydrogenase n=1 Tax=Nocardia globerula TaxID=1818 RepID=A0A652YLD4_NOCGL|nr:MULTISPECIES: NAD(P)-dependent oxidoreductase [Rhodococcus]NMD60260.1 NAD(P)-dependent oxidoreductase [Nocardia globerula]NRI67359.1 NAD(P)-dependent oxidoreductase [Rhodococcus sp. MS16]PVX63625.1 3-hydroxyisobutyrate dehydrogenase [Rhodococcus globerulus]QXW05023.1 NAD(P)-dependent oxidoreductase [Rhodococcus globerulus]ROZ50001.1 NAD(P)-dependent oxidoreductase [Rhodococcus sp. WS3]
MSVIPLPGKSVGLVGLGAMGGPIARNFVNSGQPLIVRDADAASQQRFLDSHPSAVGTTDFADFAKCDVVVLVLPTSDIVDAVVLGEGGLLSQLQAGSTIVDMGSSIPDRTQKLAGIAAEQGVRVVDAPVSGGVGRALKADLAVMAGGDADVVAEVLPLLRATGTAIIHVGPVGSGHAAKALNNLLAANGLVAAAEAMLVGRKFGIDPATLLSVINASSGRNQATETKYEKFVLSGTFDSGFAATLMRKDIGIALDLARSQDVSTVLGDTLGKIWETAVDGLAPGADQTEVVRYLEELAQVSLHD